MTSMLKQGWFHLDGDFLQQALSDYSGQEILAYFDGRPPTWSDIVNGGLPQRGVTKALATELMNYSPKSPVGRLRLIHGASGEGKTTVAMQCAAEIARSAPASYVLWRTPGAGLDTQLVQSLPTGRHYILFSDDAEEIARDLFEVVNKVTRPDISYVAVARTIDWSHVRGDAYPWATHIGYRKTYLTGLDEADAELVVAAWSRHGEKGLGRLAEWEHNDARVSELLRAIREEAAIEDGALLGGMIRVRYGDYFTDRVRDLMRSLAAQRTPSGSTLSSAFLYIAAAHLARLQLPPNILAEALGVPTSRIMSEVVIPLRDEAAVTIAGGGVLTRHRLIAEACITVAEQVNVNLAETYSRLVQSAFRVGRHHFVRDYEKYTNLCRFFEKSRPEVAIAAARAAVDEEKNSLGYIHNLAHILRKTGQADEAAFISEKTSKMLPSMQDKNLSNKERVFYREWATTEGTLGNPAVSIWLSSISLSDLRESDSPGSGHIETALAAVGGTMATMHQNVPRDEFATGVRAAETLGHLLDLSRTAKSFFSRQRRLADEWGTPKMGLDDCKIALEKAITAAWAVRERDLPHLTSAPKLRFTAMYKDLGIA
ncbi:ATP-binding protein [Streptomyces sp. NBC_00236]|nr:ATP-binding protein [Streptomyces sp. NBC_00236]